MFADLDQCLGMVPGAVVTRQAAITAAAAAKTCCATPSC